MTSSDKQPFAQTLARLAVALREPAPDVALLQVYFAALAAIEIEFVVAAADRFMVAGKWFPKTGELAAMAATIEAERIAGLRAQLRKRPAPLCPACDDTGWKRDPQDRVARCECQQLRRLEVLGRRPMPALPAAAVPDVKGELDPAGAVSVAAMVEARTGVRLTPRPMPTSARTRRDAGPEEVDDAR